MSRIVIAHGGVDIPLTPAYQATVDRAALAAYAQLPNGLLSAIESGINLMEDNPAFNAGKGSVLNRDGQIEMDALIIDGATGRAGAVAAIQGVAHPISVARRVLEATPYVLLAGSGASLFAQEHGFETCDCETTSQRAAWEQMRAKGSLQAIGINAFTGQENPKPSDTVGCVACATGELAAGVSTGGLFYKFPGRIGDSAVVGAGAFASTVCAVAGTGLGEAFHELLLARRVAQLVETGVHPQTAAEETIAFLQERRGGVGGLIVVDRHGRVGVAHNGDSLAVSVVVDGRRAIHSPVLVKRHAAIDDVSGASGSHVSKEGGKA